MGASIRSEESLTLSLPPIFWKMLTGEAVSFWRDFRHVDLSAVMQIDAIKEAQPADFDADDGMFGTLAFETTLRWVVADRGLWAARAARAARAQAAAAVPGC